MAFMAIDEGSTQHHAAVDWPVDVYKSFQGFPLGLADNDKDAHTATLPIESARIAGDTSTAALLPLEHNVYTPPDRADPGPAQDSVSIELPSETKMSDGSVAARKSASLAPYEECTESMVHKHGAHSTAGNVGDIASSLLIRKDGQKSRYTEESTGILAGRNVKESMLMTKDASGTYSLASERNAPGMKSPVSSKATSLRDVAAEDECCATDSWQPLAERAAEEGDDMVPVLAFRPEGSRTEVQPSSLSKPFGLALKLDTSPDSVAADACLSTFLLSLFDAYCFLLLHDPMCESALLALCASLLEPPFCPFFLLQPADLNKVGVFLSDCHWLSHIVLLGYDLSGGRWVVRLQRVMCFEHVLLLQVSAHHLHRVQAKHMRLSRSLPRVQAL
jgi:hypothetical protein